MLKIDLFIYFFLPVADEEFVLKEYGKDEEDDTFYCHCKKVLSYKVPLKGVQAWFGTWRRDITSIFSLCKSK